MSRRSPKKPSAPLSFIARWRWFLCLYVTSPAWLFAPIALLIPDSWSVASLFFFIIFLLIGYWGLKTQVRCKHCKTSLWNQLRTPHEQPILPYLMAAFVSRNIADSYFYGTACPSCKKPLSDC